MMSLLGRHSPVIQNIYKNIYNTLRPWESKSGNNGVVTTTVIVRVAKYLDHPKKKKSIFNLFHASVIHSWIM